jgi:hypothetical protein
MARRPEEAERREPKTWKDREALVHKKRELLDYGKPSDGCCFKERDELMASIRRV